MGAYAQKTLPFKRGETFNVDSVVTMGDTGFDHLEGQIFEVEDTEHDTGVKVLLMVVKNDTGSVITPANQLLRFNSATAKDFGRRIVGATNAAGMVCVPIDDAYASSPTIADDDLFYVVLRGWCNIMSGATSINLSAHDPVTCDNAGALGAAATAAGEFVIGTIDQATTDEDTAVRVLVDIDLHAPPAVG